LLWLLEGLRRCQPGGKLKLVLLGSCQHGGNFVDNSGGVGGGIVQQWDFPESWGKLSFIQVGLLYGWGLVDFDPSSVDLPRLNNAYLSALAAEGITLNPDGVQDGPFRSVNPYNNGQRARANIFWVWNPTDNFSLGTWASYQFDDQGFTSSQVNSNGTISSASADNHLFSVGIRPYYWLWGPFAIQAAAAYAYLSNNRRTGAGFGDGGSRSLRRSSLAVASSPVLRYRLRDLRGMVGRL
jgi:hypothetical protein